jgi:polyphosphate kinase
MSSAQKYINRDLSWLEFNRRVLEEAEDATTPLLERFQFLSIVSSNLDEFMSVRVAGLQAQSKANYTKTDFTGYTPHGLIKRLMKRTTRMVREQYRSYRDLMRLLAKEGVTLTTFRELTEEQKALMTT